VLLLLLKVRGIGRARIEWKKKNCNFFFRKRRLLFSTRLSVYECLEKLSNTGLPAVLGLAALI
jgi:hypothetical protein